MANDENVVMNTIVVQVVGEKRDCYIVDVASNLYLHETPLCREEAERICAQFNRMEIRSYQDWNDACNQLRLGLSE